jgi:oxaloacetate decarboxylase alpha subunit
VLAGDEPITCRPADLIEAEMDKLTAELKTLAREENIKLVDNEIDDVLIYALFPQVGTKFLKNRGNPDAFEPAPDQEAKAAAAPAKTADAPATAEPGQAESYRVSVNGTEYDVVVGPGNADISQIKPAAAPLTPAPAAAAGPGTEVKAPLSGSIIEVLVTVGQKVNDGDPVFIIEAMKMETEIRASASGTIQSIAVKKGESIQSDQSLMVIG